LMLTRYLGTCLHGLPIMQHLDIQKMIKGHSFQYKDELFQVTELYCNNISTRTLVGYLKDGFCALHCKNYRLI
jgi:hypothetical protein